MAVKPPKPPDRTRQTLSQSCIVLHCPTQGRTQIVVIVFKPVQPFSGSRRLQKRFGFFTESLKIIGVPLLCHCFLTACSQSLAAVLANDLQHPKPHFTVSLLLRD